MLPLCGELNRTQFDWYKGDESLYGFISWTKKFGLNNLSDMPKLKEVADIIESDPSLGEQITAFEDNDIENKKIGDEEVSDAVE